VRITTIRSAKGLESPVVIVTELDGLQAMRASSPARCCHYLYIATSRAKHHLVVLASR
jgi:ATP-dependent exoDNAse (exonuclease V) beta subunit